jgi:transcriptional regulator with XRE-family HTH domain
VKGDTRILGRMLLAVRCELDLTQEAVAAAWSKNRADEGKAPVDRGRVSTLEHGRNPMSEATLDELAAAVGLSTLEFLEMGTKRLRAGGLR